MKIYTKTGDKGETSLLGGTRVSKSDARIEAYGTIDELNSCIGLVVSSVKTHREFLISIQHHLFNAGSILASDGRKQFKLPEITDKDIHALEVEIDRMNEILEPLKNFILPGGSVAASHAHVARCVCRRAERRVVDLKEDYSDIVKYLNRLSDYLFVLSRSILQEEGVPEVKWDPNYLS